MTRLTLYTPAQRAEAHQAIVNAPDGAVVTIKEEGSQSDKQRNLSFRWYADLAKQKEGWTATDARAYCKLHFGIALLRETEPDYRDQWDSMFRDTLSYEQKLALMVEPHDYPVTRLLGVKGMIEYLDRVQRGMAEKGYWLSDPSALKYQQEFE